jgi:hypothetical protein
MTDDRLLQAARENAEWCDAMCRAHGSPGTFTPMSWTNPGRTPPYYPDAVSLVPEATWADLRDGVEGKQSASVKDSFATIRPPGWDLLFEAEWIYRPALAVDPSGEGGTVDPAVIWDVVRGPGTLREWERAHFPGESLELFPAELLSEVTVLAGRVDGDLVCGSLLHDSGGVTGVSNLFASGCDLDTAWAGTVATAAGLFPDRPLVGYESDPAPACRHGFTTIGPLRVWVNELS